jgi:uncharacterized protein Yka (UPF0111/DUF47 family)
MTRVPLLFRKEPDVLGLLRVHAAAVRDGIASFAEWSVTGATAAGDAVRSARFNGQEAHTTLVHALMDVLSTPVDREDIYLLSERLQDVIVVAKTTVREADAFGFRADTHSAAMGRMADAAVHSLCIAVEALRADTETALGAVADAGSACGDLDRAYRQAVVSSWDGVDVRTTISRQNVYRRYTELAAAIERVAHRVWFGILKEA